MPKYAANTEVSSARSRAEIEDTLIKYGAESFAYATTADKAMIAFQMNGRQARVYLPMPRLEDYRLTETGRSRTASSQKTAWEQACRQIWRIMLLLIKAKLEAIAFEVSTFDREFLSDTVLPNGQTVGEYILPQVEQAYISGQMPPMLPMLED